MSNISRAFTPEYSEAGDVAKIQQFVEGKGMVGFTLNQFSILWAKFSDDLAASWLNVDDHRLEQFWDWLQQ